jgi:hypothetical protein
MHPAGYYLARTYLAGPRHQTQHDALGRGTQPRDHAGAGTWCPHCGPSGAGAGRAASRASPKRSIPLTAQSRSKLPSL